MSHPSACSVMRLAAMLGVSAGLAACGTPPPQALGTLEYDRIALPAPAAERIVGIDVRDVFLVLEQEGVDKFEKSWQELLEATQGQLDEKKS